MLLKPKAFEPFWESRPPKKFYTFEYDNGTFSNDIRNNYDQQNAFENELKRMKTEKREFVIPKSIDLTYKSIKEYKSKPTRSMPHLEEISKLKNENESNDDELQITNKKYFSNIVPVPNEPFMVRANGNRFFSDVRNKHEYFISPMVSQARGTDLFISNGLRLNTRKNERRNVDYYKNMWKNLQHGKKKKLKERGTSYVTIKSMSGRPDSAPVALNTEEPEDSEEDDDSISVENYYWKIIKNIEKYVFR